MPKYKNYRNNFSKSNVIYTNADLSRMSFGEASNRRKELVSQYRQIGFPSEKEMQNSSNVVYVNEYTRADGTHVKAHWRSKPEGSGSGTFAPEGQPNIIFDEGEPTVVFDESASNNLEEDVGIYFPTTMPTKAPDGPVIYPVETGEGSGTTIGDIIDGVLGWLSLLLEIMTILLGSNTAPVVDDGEMELQVDNSPLGNFVVPVSSSETSSKPLKFENINNEEFIQRFISEMMGLGGSGVGNVLPQIAGDGIIRNEKSPNARFDKANFDKGTSIKQKQGVTFDNAKTTSNPINQPMAQHSDSDIENYINELMQPSANKSKSEMRDSIISLFSNFEKNNKNYFVNEQGLDIKNVLNFATNLSFNQIKNMNPVQRAANKHQTYMLKHAKGYIKPCKTDRIMTPLDEFTVNGNLFFNKNYPDALEMFEIGIFKPESYDDNNQFIKIPKSKNKEYQDRYDIKFDLDYQGIMFNEKSDFSKRVSNSKELREQVLKYYDKNTKSFRTNKILLNFEKDKNLHLSIGHATLLNPELTSDGHVKGILFDIYDFEWSKDYEDPSITVVTDIAVILHYLKSLDYYYYFIPIEFVF